MENNDRALEEAAFVSANGSTEMPNEVKTEEVVDPIVPQQEEAKPDPLQEILTRLEKFEKGHASLAGQVGGLKQTQKAIEEKLQAAYAVSNSASNSVNKPTEAQINQAAQDPEEWENMRSEYPEYTIATEKFLDSKLSGLKSNQGEFEALNNELVAVKKKMEEDAAKSLKKEQDFELRLHHKDWRSVVTDQSFLDWYSKNNLDDSSDPDVIAGYVTQYKDTLKPPPETKNEQADIRRKRLENSVQPRGSGGVTVKHDPTELEAFLSAAKS